MSAIKYVLIVTVIIFNTGCALGVGYFSPTTVSYEKNEFKVENNYIADIRGEKQKEELNVVYNKQFVIHNMGDPDKIKKSNGLEVWTYNEDIVWQGPVIGFGIPIPIPIIPSGRYKTVLIFKGENLDKVEKIKSKLSYIGFLHGSNEGGWTAFSVVE